MTHHPTDPAATGHWRHAALLGALAALLLLGWRRVEHTHRQRLAHRSAPLPERLQNWEGEGGRPAPQATPGDAGATDSNPAPDVR
jgi:hypothetical protein